MKLDTEIIFEHTLTAPAGFKFDKNYTDIISLFLDTENIKFINDGSSLVWYDSLYNKHLNSPNNHYEEFLNDYLIKTNNYNF